MASPTAHRSAGQAALEYLGVLSLVAIVLGGAAAAGPGDGVGRAVVRALERGICVATGAVCTPEAAREAGLAPCPVRSRSNAEQADVSVALVRLGRSDALVIERRSDGTASVSFVDGWRGGAGAGAGLHFSPARVSGEAEVAGGLTFSAGRTWDFATWADADRFVGRHARHETLTGEARGLCPWCRDDEPPPPSAVFREAGPFVSTALDARIPAGERARAGAELTAASVLGRRTAGRRTTTYLRLAGESAGRLGLVVGSLGTDGAGEAVLEITSDGGRPVELRVAAAASLGARVELLGATADLAKLADRLRRARAGAGGGDALAAEASVALDLRDGANRAALAGVLRALRHPASLPTRLADLGRRLDARGDIDVRVFRAATTRRGTEAEAGLGLKLGGSYERAERTRELLAAWSRPGGGPLRDREDCVSA